MPMLIYWPWIVWMGMLEAAQNDMRAPVCVKAKTKAASRGLTPQSARRP